MSNILVQYFKTDVVTTITFRDNDVLDIHTPNKTKSVGGNPFACIIAQKSDDGKSIKYGYSICNPKDTFDKRIAKSKAMEMLLSDEDNFIPNKLLNQFDYFQERAEKYFKINEEQEDFVERIGKEQEDLKDKISKLSSFLYTDKFKELSKHEQILLIQQFAFMNAYEGVLNDRYDFYTK
jgi:hypothetical protein